MFVVSSKYEYLGKMGQTSRNLFFHLFEVCLSSKGVVGHMFVFLRRAQNQISRVYVDSWKYFKPNYFLAKLLSPLTHEEFWFVSPNSCQEKWLHGSTTMILVSENIFPNVPKVIGSLMKLLVSLIKIRN